MKVIIQSVLSIFLALSILGAGTGLVTYHHTCHMMGMTDVGLIPKKCCGEKNQSECNGPTLKRVCCDNKVLVNKIDLKPQLIVKASFGSVFAFPAFTSVFSNTSYKKNESKVLFGSDSSPPIFSGREIQLRNQVFLI